jgi:hypothetical protein
MPECTTPTIVLPSFDRRKIQLDFEGGEVTSDAGVMLLRQVDRQLGLTGALDAAMPDPRDPRYIIHPQGELIAQRVYGLALGYEDLNDHKSLSTDLAWQSALERDRPLGSPSTLCRVEKRMNAKVAWAFHQVLLDQFIKSHAEPPAELILDFDATDDRVHGLQEGRAYHAYYGDWCYLPLYVFCGERLLVSYLRPSNRDGARHAGAILALLVRALRRVWPEVRIIFRADSGFCRRRILTWCERRKVSYVVGLAKNARLKKLAHTQMDAAAEAYAQSQHKQRSFAWLDYTAGTWKGRQRKVIAKAEHTAKGANPRFVITNLKGEPQDIYDRLYCARGEMENRIKEQQMGLFADRTSSRWWWANQLRLLYSSAAYVLLEAVRRLTLAGTELARAQVGTIRLKLLKVGAVILRNTRRIRLHLPSAYPYKELFAQVLEKLGAQVTWPAASATG